MKNTKSFFTTTIISAFLMLLATFCNAEKTRSLQLSESRKAPADPNQANDEEALHSFTVNVTQISSRHRQ